MNGKLTSERLAKFPVRMSELDTLKVLVDEVVQLEANNDVLRDALEEAQSAIESLDIEALGRVPDSPEWGIGWSIREELLLKIKTALR